MVCVAALAHRRQLDRPDPIRRVLVGPEHQHAARVVVDGRRCGVQSLRQPFRGERDRAAEAVLVVDDHIEIRRAALADGGAAGAGVLVVDDRGIEVRHRLADRPARTDSARRRGGSGPAPARDTSSSPFRFTMPGGSRRWPSKALMRMPKSSSSATRLSLSSSTTRYGSARPAMRSQ